AVQAARAAFDTGPWGRLTGKERGRLMRRLAEVIAEHADEVAAVEVTDNGKLIREMAGQLQGLPDYYEYFAGAADKIHGETIPADRSNFFIYTVREPAGVVGAITPWNSPVLLMSWKLAPALAAGCTFVSSPPSRPPPPPSSSPGWSPRPASRPACSTSSPASAPRPAARSPSTPAWTRSRSPAPPPP